ncbi:MAG: PorV/PorQ family protein [Candidatus Zixiibacteriota bacterium]
MVSKTTKFLVVFCLLSVVCFSSAWADDNHMLPMLRMGVGARALAMGGAYVAEAHDATAGYWNPAGLADIKCVSLAAMYSAGMAVDRNYNYFGLGWTPSQVTNYGTFGITWLNSGIDDISKYDAGNNNLGTFKDMNNAFIVSWAFKNEFKQKMFSFGLSLKVIQQKIDDYSKTGFGGDAGIKFVVDPRIALGLAVRDLGTKVDNWTVPTSIGVGLAIYPLGEDHALCIPIDYGKTINRSDQTFHFGAEYNWEFAPNYSAALMAGLNDGKFSAGVGFKVSKIRLDYAYVTEKADFLNQNHRISLSADF